MSFARAITSSSVENFPTDKTGPKICHCRGIGQKIGVRFISQLEDKPLLSPVRSVCQMVVA